MDAYVLFIWDVWCLMMDVCIYNDIMDVFNDILWYAQNDEFMIQTKSEP